MFHRRVENVTCILDIGALPPREFIPASDIGYCKFQSH